MNFTRATCEMLNITRVILASNVLQAGLGEKTHHIVPVGFPLMYEMKVLQTIYRIEAKDKRRQHRVVHLMLRVVVPEQTRDNRICILIRHIYSAPGWRPGFRFHFTE